MSTKNRLQSDTYLYTYAITYFAYLYSAMKTATVTEFRSRAKELLQEVEDDQDILILSRPKNKESFVVLTMKHFESLEETAHLLSTPANAERLSVGIAQHKAGKIAHTFQTQETTRARSAKSAASKRGKTKARKA